MKVTNTNARGKAIRAENGVDIIDVPGRSSIERNLTDGEKSRFEAIDGVTVEVEKTDEEIAAEAAAKAEAEAADAAKADKTA